MIAIPTVIGEHKIKKGETLDKIAKKNDIKNWKKLWTHKENKKVHDKHKGDERAIKPGEVIRIPFDLLRTPMVIFSSNARTLRGNLDRLRQRPLEVTDRVEGDVCSRPQPKRERRQRKPVPVSFDREAKSSHPDSLREVTTQREGLDLALDRLEEAEDTLLMDFEWTGFEGR